MASEYIRDQERFITIDKADAVEIIAYLSAQLAGIPAPNSASGAVPQINVTEYGQIKYRLYLTVDTKK